MKADPELGTRTNALLGANLFDELIVDNFAGAGGASMGIEAASGRSVDIAINHDRHIGLRMLTPRELLRAQFGKYARDYILVGTKSQQVARIGNSVPPELAEAIVRANFELKAEVAA